MEKFTFYKDNVGGSSVDDNYKFTVIRGEMDKKKIIKSGSPIIEEVLKKIFKNRSSIPTEVERYRK